MPEATTVTTTCYCSHVDYEHKLGWPGPCRICACQQFRVKPDEEASEPHVHRWKLTPPDGPVVHEHCEGCSSRRDVPASRESGWDSARFATKDCAVCGVPMSGRSDRCQACHQQKSDEGEAEVIAAMEARKALGPLSRHGTVHDYNNLGCRCDECKAVSREYQANKREKRNAAAAAGANGSAIIPRNIPAPADPPAHQPAPNVVEEQAEVLMSRIRDVELDGASPGHIRATLYIECATCEESAFLPGANVIKAGEVARQMGWRFQPALFGGWIGPVCVAKVMDRQWQRKASDVFEAMTREAVRG